MPAKLIHKIKITFFLPLPPGLATPLKESGNLSTVDQAKIHSETMRGLLKDGTIKDVKDNKSTVFT